MAKTISDKLAETAKVATTKVTDLVGVEGLHINELPLKKVPSYMRRKGGIWYWTGALITMAFVYQVVTGLILLLYYDPANAYDGTEALISTVPYGALILSTHLYGAYAMIVLIYVHMFRNYFTAAYKKPRQLQWILGVVLLGLTLGVAYFGYSMTGDQLSLDATDVGRGIAESVPVLGTFLETVVFGNGTSTDTFMRMLGWHIIFTALVGLVFGLHFYLAESNSIMPKSKDTKDRFPAVDTEKPDYKPWYPYNFAFMAQLAMFAFGFIILVPSIVALIPSVPVLFSPFPISPSQIPLVQAGVIPAYPPWFLLFLYKAVDFNILPYEVGPLAGLAPYFVISTIFGGVPAIYFIILPFIDRSNDRHPLSRPIITSFGILSIIYLVLLSVWGAAQPGIPISMMTVAVVFLIPFFVVVLSILYLSRLYRAGKFKISVNRLIASYLIYIFLFIGALLVFSENFAAFMARPDGLNLVSTIFTGGATSFIAFGVMKSSDYTSQLEKETVVKQAFRISKNSAIAIATILTILTIAITYIIFTLNPITGAMEFGVGLGFDLILAGIVLRLYRLVAYDE
ncbi:MAG: cytochrome bc complex cytochrome b subunit [Thermoplasmataceae archaeon]|jgi:quinol-cytochrome oxidoreductase complex cytochrome b subunit